ncbi:MAG: maleylpyruvate isomerase family mycothiol-dependent enzyme [Actinomycetia bacterium]|nr:maleylpyruvate isomerase family mycothiol-dependent enzyme [Actinomycetes bacterium]
MDTSDPDLITSETRAERTRLADLLADLDPARWDADSLCDGWRVREVVAHMTMPFRLSGPRFLAGIIRARMSFNRLADRDARAATRTSSDADLLAVLRANVDHPWTPPGGGPVGALSHDVIHGLDVTVPLGLPGPPPSRIAVVLDSSGPRNLKYFGVDLDGSRLVATDADAAIGEGVPHRMTAEEMLLVVTGRRALSDVTAT